MNINRICLLATYVMISMILCSCSNGNARYVIVKKLEYSSSHRELRPYESLYKIDSKTGKTWKLTAESIWVPMITENNYDLNSIRDYVENQVVVDFGDFGRLEPPIINPEELKKKIAKAFKNRGVDISADDINP